jgi:hypothetical protein
MHYLLVPALSSSQAPRCPRPPARRPGRRRTFSAQSLNDGRLMRVRVAVAVTLAASCAVFAVEFLSTELRSSLRASSAPTFPPFYLWHGRTATNTAGIRGAVAAKNLAKSDLVLVRPRADLLCSNDKIVKMCTRAGNRTHFIDFV